MPPAHDRGRQRGQRHGTEVGEQVALEQPAIQLARARPQVDPLGQPLCRVVRERLSSAGGVDPRAARQVGLQRGQPTGGALPARERLWGWLQPSIDIGGAGLPSS